MAFDFTPQTVDISNGPASITVTARITDATGAEAPTISFGSDSTSQSAGFGVMTRTSGTAQDGTYTRTITIPQGAAPGTWSASLFPLSDTAGNHGSFGPPAGFPKTLTVNAGSSATTPAAPAIWTPWRGDASATVRWAAPTNTGGSTITGYTIRTYRGTTLVKTTTASATARSLTVTGLTNGTAYTFTVAATNAVGTGAASARSTAVTPATRPGAPAIWTPWRGDASATVRWAAPTNTGGSTITGYTIRTYRGTTLVKTTTASATARSLTVTGLTNGTAYTFTVAATNAVGTGAASARSTAVTPATRPGAPAIWTPWRGDASATVRWAAPTNTGGSTITGYVIRTYKGTTLIKTTTASATARSLTVTGLTNGTAYTFTVAAKNAVGTGSASARSTAVTPVAPPPPAPPAPYYDNCDAVRAAGAAPLHRGQPGFRSGLDRDGDGVACEV
ncbi:fibronectin type III domain-containing protein [Geodermatophilus sp. URMC 65]